MYQSINKFDALPDFLQVWPGHGGSACGKALERFQVQLLVMKK
jgi:hydroxyacylglutathione hydrolase